MRRWTSVRADGFGAAVVGAVEDEVRKERVPSPVEYLAEPDDFRDW